MSMDIYKASNLIINPRHRVYRRGGGGGGGDGVCVCVWGGGQSTMNPL